MEPWWPRPNALASPRSLCAASIPIAPERSSLALRTIDLVGETPFGCYEIVLDDGEIVGGAGFHGLPSTDGVVEIGYGVASSRRNRRVATAAIRALVAMASRNGVTCIVARTDPANAPSKRALAAAGFGPATSHDQYDRHELRLEAPDRSVMFGNRRPRASSEATGAEHG